MAPHQSLAVELVERFRLINRNFKPPPWAHPFKPAIPLIGERFVPGRSLLVYASAENFTWMNGKSVPDRFTNEHALDRYRVEYEQAGRSSRDFFPDVGIQPATDGGIFAAALFVSERLGLPTASKPRTFLKHIALSNWCKFTVKARDNRNHDYPGDIKKLTESIPYVVAELALLQPGVVLLPDTIWKHRLLAATMQGTSPRTRFIGVPQFNATVVNCNLGKHSKPAGALARRYASKPLGAWMGKLEGMCKANAWRYIVVLRDALSDHPPGHRGI